MFQIDAMEYQIKRKTNYGLFTDVSKSLNMFFGDTSGRTVSMRTAHGFKNIFNCQQMDDDDAEHIVHAGMGTAYLLLKSKNENEHASGIILSIILLCCYQSGNK